MKKIFEGYLLDTNICIDYLKACSRSPKKWTTTQKHTYEKIETIKEEKALYMSEATLGELLFGVEKSQQKEKNLKRVNLLQEIIPTALVDKDVWKIFAKIKAELSQKGRPIADMDLLIAATAKRYNYLLISNDKDMDNLDFLTENPLERESWYNDDDDSNSRFHTSLSSK